MSRRVYVVGGAIRNILLGLPVNDVDYVVVGATVEEMLAEGYQLVGADFPVFLKDGCEYALARTERKSGVGHHGFKVDTKDVTLEDDLLRRDLTINAMAVDVDDWPKFLTECDRAKYVIDPYNGLRDLELGLIRPVRLDTFIEDPLRVLRAARFAAVYNMDWTRDMRQAANHVFHSKELDHLPAERFGLELEKAIKQCATTGDFGRFLGLLDQVIDAPTETLEIFASESIRNQSDVTKTLGSKLRLLSWPELTTYLQEKFNISNLMVEQIKLAARVHHLPYRISTNSGLAPSTMFEVYSDAVNAKEGAGLEFVRDMLSDYPVGDVAYEWLMKVDKVFSEVRFATLDIPENLPKHQYAVFIKTKRIEAVRDIWNNRA